MSLLFLSANKWPCRNVSVAFLVGCPALIAVPAAPLRKFQSLQPTSIGKCYGKEGDRMGERNRIGGREQIKITATEGRGIEQRRPKPLHQSTQKIHFPLFLFILALFIFFITIVLLFLLLPIGHVHRSGRGEERNETKEKSNESSIRDTKPASTKMEKFQIKLYS